MLFLIAGFIGIIFIGMLLPVLTFWVQTSNKFNTSKTMKLNHTKTKSDKAASRLHARGNRCWVVAIIGTLAALVIPRIAGTGEHSKEQVAAAQTDIHGGIKTALSDHYARYGQRFLSQKS